jgi:hypothetical protein
MKELLIYVFGQHYGKCFLDLGTPTRNIEKMLKLKDEGLSPAEIHKIIVEPGRVVVNKNVLEHRIVEEIERTILIAKKAAERGMEYFFVTYPYEMRYELYEITSRVAEQTCKTVQCRERGLCTDTASVNYAIR